jgi:hypothetical protein
MHSILTDIHMATEILNIASLCRCDSMLKGSVHFYNTLYCSLAYEGGPAFLFEASRFTKGYEDNFWAVAFGDPSQ